MFNNIFYTRISVVFLVLFLICFFDFAYLPAPLSLKNDQKLFYVLSFILISGIGLYRQPMNVFSKRLNYLFALLFAFAVVNCVSCYYFRHQAPWITFFHWSPVFLIYLYYPFRTLHFSVKSWETILFSLFIIEATVEIIQNLFPTFHFFTMTSGDEKFDRELRVRVYGNAILYIGSLFCLNKLLLSVDRKMFYEVLYLLSLILMLFGGYRIVLFAILLSSLIMIYRIKKLSVKTFSILILLILTGWILVGSSAIDSRINEILDRNEVQNLENDEYVRTITYNYYLTDYFKSPAEFVMGSGMVHRTFTKNNDFAGKYESRYSREVSDASIRYHIFPIDWGLIGFSWEAGIPAALVLVSIALMLIFTKNDDKYMYMSSWGIFVLIFSITNGRYYSHHNLIYTAILLVICDKLCQVKKLKKLNK